MSLVYRLTALIFHEWFVRVQLETLGKEGSNDAHSAVTIEDLPKRHLGMPHHPGPDFYSVELCEQAKPGP
jgi:hypothetical protein